MKWRKPTIFYFALTDTEHSINPIILNMNLSKVGLFLYFVLTSKRLLVLWTIVNLFFVVKPQINSVRSSESWNVRWIFSVLSFSQPSYTMQMCTYVCLISYYAFHFLKRKPKNFCIPFDHSPCAYDKKINNKPNTRKITVLFEQNND